MSEPSKDCRFIASASDPSRAEAISDEEYERLLAGLRDVVMLHFSAAAVQLRNAGFSIVKLECRAALASLTVQKRKAGISAWFYFQIHRTFGPLLTSERVYWMYSVNRAHGAPAGRAGRLPDLGDAEQVKSIAVDFITECLSISWVSPGGKQGAAEQPPPPPEISLEEARRMFALASPDGFGNPVGAALI